MAVSTQPLSFFRCVAHAVQIKKGWNAILVVVFFNLPESIDYFFPKDQVSKANSFNSNCKYFPIKPDFNLLLQLDVSILASPNPRELEENWIRIATASVYRELYKNCTACSFLEKALRSTKRLLKKHLVCETINYSIPLS